MYFILLFVIWFIMFNISLLLSTLKIKLVSEFLLSQKGKRGKQCGPANNVVFTEWNKKKKQTKISQNWRTANCSFHILMILVYVFWTLVGAVRRNNSFTYHVQIFTSATLHYRPVLVPSDILFSSLQRKRKRIASWEKKKKKIWLKQGSGYHAVSIHAELFNSYTLSNQI